LGFTFSLNGKIFAKKNNYTDWLETIPIQKKILTHFFNQNNLANADELYIFLTSSPYVDQGQKFIVHSKSLTRTHFLKEGEKDYNKLQKKITAPSILQEVQTSFKSAEEKKLQNHSAEAIGGVYYLFIHMRKNNSGTFEEVYRVYMNNPEYTHASQDHLNFLKLFAQI
jgi:hypothetical protein